MSEQTSQVLSKEELSRLLELRRQKKDKTPYFQRQESWRYVRIHEPWRKPKGVDSHMRLSVKGWPALVKIGYRVPRAVRGLHPSGYRDILVHNRVELETLSPQTDAARLAAGVGRRKRIELATRAKELGIRVLNGRGLLFGQRIDETSETGPTTERQKEGTKEEAIVTPSTVETEKTPETKTPAKPKKKAKKPKPKKKAKKKKTTTPKKKTKKKKKEDSD